MKKLAALVLALLFLPGNVSGQSEGVVRPDVQRMLNDINSDSVPREEAEWLEHQLSTRPDITQDLFTALERDYFNAARRGKLPDNSALCALQWRKDLGPLQLKIITDEMKRLAGGQVGRDRHSEDFIYAGIGVLRHYPSPEHEELVLRFIDDPRGPICESVIATLGMMGTQRSRAELEAWRDRIRIKYPDALMLENLNSAIAAIDQRLSARGEVELPGASSPQKQQASSKREGWKPREYEFSSVLPWLIPVLVVAGGALFLALKQRGR